MATLTKDANGNYIIKAGDSLSKIATQQGRTLQDLLVANPQFASNPNAIQPGQVVYNNPLSLKGGSNVPLIPSYSTNNANSTSSGVKSSIPSPYMDPNRQLIVNAQSNNAPAPTNTTPSLSYTTTSGGGGSADTSASFAGGYSNDSSTSPTDSSTQTSSAPDLRSVMMQIIKDSQTQAGNQYTGNKAALYGGQQNIDQTNANTYSKDLANANLSNEARAALLNGDGNLQAGGLKSIEAQQGMNEAHYKTSLDVLKTTQDAIQKQTDQEIEMYKAGHSSTANNQMTDNERALMTQFNSNPIVKDYNTIISQKNYFDKIVGSGVGGPADLAAIFTFMKGLDPNSVVRETEYDNAAKSGNIFQGIWARFNGYFKETGGILPENVKKEFQNLVNLHFQSQKIQYDNWANSIRGIASRQNLNPDNVVVDFSGGTTQTDGGGGGGNNNSGGWAI